MADQIMWGTDLLRPIWRGLMDDVRGAHVLHLDATGLPVRDKDSVKGITLGSLWGYVGVTGDDKSAVYLYASTGKRWARRWRRCRRAVARGRRRGRGESGALSLASCKSFEETAWRTGSTQRTSANGVSGLLAFASRVRVRQSRPRPRPRTHSDEPSCTAFALAPARLWA